MTEALDALPVYLRDRLAAALEAGHVGPTPTAAALRSVLGRVDSSEQLAASLQVLARLGIAGPGAAAWLRSVDRAASQTRKPDVVWSGPEVAGLFARDTRQVYDELLGAAQHSLWASTYVYYDGPKTFDVLARHLDESPALEVTLLLNIQRKWGDTTDAEQPVRRFADRLWKTDWPGSRHPRVFYDPRALDPDRPAGVLHAKAVVADDETVFITSANLTEAALDRNIELGLLVRDRALALTVTAYFQGLIDRSLLKPLPLT